MEASPKKSGNYSGVFAVCMLSALFILIGALMHFVPQMKMVYFAYMIAGVFAVTGIWLIILYFSRHEYRTVANYDFSIGVFLMLIGILILTRANDLAQHVLILLGGMCLLEGVIILQNAIQIKILRGKVWAGILACSLLVLVASILVVMDPGGRITAHMPFLYFLLIIIGILGFVSMLTVWIHTIRFNRENEEKVRRNLEEADNVPSDETDMRTEDNIFDQDDLVIEPTEGEEDAADTGGGNPAAPGNDDKAAGHMTAKGE